MQTQTEAIHLTVQEEISARIKAVSKNKSNPLARPLNFEFKTRKYINSDYQLVVVNFYKDFVVETTKLKGEVTFYDLRSKLKQENLFK